MAESVVIGGETVSLPDFNAYKALLAMDIIGEVESSFREVVSDAAAYRHDWEEKHYIEVRRADARRRFRPEPLMRLVQDENTISEVPVLDETGAPVIGPDPLAHLTEADWQASGHVLRLPESPGDDHVMAALLPKATRLAKTQVMRLLALATTTNRDLEQWDGEKDIDGELDRIGKKLMHDATPGELIRLAIAVMRIARDELRDPFDEAVAAWASLRTPTTEPSPEDPDDAMVPEPEPMRIETETGSSPTSSIESPADTAGTAERSSTAPAGVS